MRLTLFLSTALLACAGMASMTHAECPLDHYRVGQDNGTMICNAWQLYRHWNNDYGTNPDPYGADYYEWIQTIMGSYNRTEPGPGYVEDPNYHFPGTPNVDYRIMLQRLYASPAMSFYEGVSPILSADGDAVCTSTYSEFHFHMRYVVPNAPGEPTFVMFRYYDDFFDSNDPNAGGYRPSRPWVVHFGAEPNYYALNLTLGNPQYGTVTMDPEPPMPVTPGAHYDPNAEPNDPPAYPQGVPVTLSAVPAEGRGFNTWQIFDPNFPGDANHAAADANLSITLLMDQDREVKALFKCGSGLDQALPLLTVASLVCAAVNRRSRRGPRS
ncbi:MAG: hypothetical protein JXQ73_33185 [Phycisphaerae bacterium]|nr:hypothetical protein [Phycisphaerae bacterium]